MLKMMGVDVPGMGGKSIPRLSWLNGKTYVQSNGGRKNSPGLRSEHAEAFVENASRDFTKQVDLVLNPPVDISDIAPEATV
jgi:hypothetical protein